jgi:hypothetical protein
MTVRLPWLERGVYEALAGTADVVAWSHGAQPRVGGSLLSLHLEAGPHKGLRGGSRHGGVIRPRATGAVVTIGSVTEGERVELRLDGFRHLYDVLADDDVSAVRDALLASVTEKEGESFEATALDDDAIVLTPVSVSSLWDIAVAGDLEAELEHSGYVRVHEFTERALLQLSAYTRGKTLATSARATLGSALSRLRSHDVLLELQRWGVGVLDLGEVIDLSAVAAGSWESRATADVQLSCRSALVEAVDIATTVVFEATLVEEV